MNFQVAETRPRWTMSWGLDQVQQSNKAQVSGPLGKANEARSRPRRRRFTAECLQPVVDRPRKRLELHSSCRGTNRSRRSWSSTEKERKGRGRWRRCCSHLSIRRRTGWQLSTWRPSPGASANTVLSPLHSPRFADFPTNTSPDACYVSLYLYWFDEIMIWWRSGINLSVRAGRILVGLRASRFSEKHFRLSCQFSWTDLVDWGLSSCYESFNFTVPCMASFLWRLIRSFWWNWRTDGLK